MARLFAGEKKGKKRSLLQLLRMRLFGLRESEIASDLGWERRTANNYLREMQQQGQVYKEGRSWFSEK